MKISKITKRMSEGKSEGMSDRGGMEYLAAEVSVAREVGDDIEVGGAS